eukprot:g7995.t1
MHRHARKSVNGEGRLAEFELQRATANAVRFSEASWNTDGAVDIFVDDVRAVYKNFYDFARTYGLRLDDSATFQAFGEGLNEGQQGVDQNALPLSLAGAGTVREEEQEDLARDKQQRKLALKRDVADFLWLERMKVSTNSEQVVVFCDGSALGLADFARVAANDLMLSLQAGTSPAAAGANEASQLLVGSFASVAFSSADLHLVGAAAGTGAGDPAESRAVAAERFGVEMVRSTHRKLAENANDDRMLDLGVREVTEDAGADENETAIAKLHNRVVVQAELRAILEGLQNAAGVSPAHGDDDVEEIVVFTDSDSALRVVRQVALATSSTPAARLAPVGDERYAKMFPHLFARVQDSVRMLQDRFARLRSVRFSYFPGHADKLTDSAGFHGAVDLMARRALGSRTGFLWDAGADWASTFAAAAVLAQNRSPTRRLRDLLRRRQSLVLQRLEVAASSTSKKRRRSAGPGGLTRPLGGPADDPRSADPGRGPVQKRSLSELLTTSELAEWDAEHAGAYRAIVAQKQADEEAAAEQGELVAALAEGMAKMDLNNNDGGQRAANQGGQPVVDPSKAAFVTHSLRFIDSTLGDLGAAFTTEPLFQQTPPQLRGKVEGEKNLVWCARLGWAPEECLFPAEYADHGLFTALFGGQGEAWRGRLNVLRKDLDTRSRKLVRFLDASPEGRNAARYLPGTQAQQDEVQTWLRDASARLTAALGAFTRLLSISLSPRVTEDDLYLRWKAALGRAAAYAPNVREDARLLQECEDAPACRAGPALVALKRNLMRLQLQPLWDVLGSAILVRETSTDLHQVDPFSEVSSSAESGASPEQGSEESDPSPPEQPCGSFPEDGNSPAAVAAVDGEQDAGATNEETFAVSAEVDVDVDAVHSPSEEDHVSGDGGSTSDGAREPSDDADPTSITTTLAEFADELRHEEIAHLRTFELVVPPGSRPESDGGRLVWFPLRVRGRRGRAAAGDVEQMAQMDYSMGQEDQDQHDARGVDRPSLLHDSALTLPVRAFHASSEEKLRLFAKIEESVNDFRVDQELHRRQRAAEKAAQMEEYRDGRRREEALRLVRSQRDFEARRATRESAAIGEVKARLVQGVLLAEARERLENTGIAANGLEGAMMSTGSASLGGGGRAEGTSVADMLAAVAAQPAERISVEQQEASTNDGYAELLRQKARRQRAGKSAREAGDVLAGSTSPLRQTTAQEKLLFRIEEELIARKLLPETDLQGKAAAGKAPLSREAAELLARNLLGLWTHDVKHHGRGRSRAGSPRAHRETGDDEESDRIAAEAARILGEIPTEDFLEAADDDSDLEEEEEDRAREPDHQGDEGMGRDTDANGWSWYKVRRASQYDDFRQGWTQYDISGFENEGSRRLWPTTGADGHLGGRFVRLERDVYETVTVRPREESEGTTARLGEEVRVLVGRKGEIGRLLTPFPAAAEEEAHRGAAGPTNEAAHDLPPTAAPSFLYDLVMEAPGRKLYNTGGFSSGFSRLLSRVPRDAFRPVLLDDDRGATSDTFGLIGGLYSGHGFLPGPLAEVSRKFALDVDRYAADVDDFLTRELLARAESGLAEARAAKVRDRDEALDEMNDLENRPDRGYTNLKLLLLRNGHPDHAGALDAVRAFMRSLVEHGQGREKEEQLRRNTAAHDPDAVHESLRRLAVFLVVKVFVPLKELIARERAAEVPGRGAAAQAQRGPGLLGDELERLLEAYMKNWFRSYARIAEQAVALGSATEWLSWIAPHDVAQDRPTVAGLVEAVSGGPLAEKLLAYLRPRSSFWLIADWHPLYYQRNEMLLRRSLGEGRSAALATAVADAGAAQVAQLRAGRLGDGLLQTGPGEATTPAAAVFDRLVANLEHKRKEAVWTDMAVEECPADHVFGLHPTGDWSNPFRSSDAAAQRPGARPFLERGSAAGEQGTPEVGAGGAHRAGAGVSAPSAYRAEVERYLSDVRRARREAGALGGATSVFHSGELVRTVAGVFQTTRQLAGLTTASAALADALESHAETTKLKQSKGTALKVPIVSTTLTGRVDRRLRYFRHLLLQESVLSTGRDLAEPPQAGPPSPTNSPREPLAQEASRTTWGPVAGALATHLLELDVAEKTATEEEALKLVTKLAFSPSPAGPLKSERRNKWRASQAAGVASKEALLFQMQGTEREQYRAFLQRARGLYVRSCGAARDASMLQPERAARGIVPVLESYLREHGNISAKTRSNLAEWLRRLGLYTQESVFAARERQWEPQEFQAHQAHAFPEDLTEQNNFLRHFDATLARYHASAFSDMLAAVERLARPPEQTHRVVQTRIVPAALPSPADAVAASLTTTPSDGAGAPASATGTGGGVGSTAGEGVAADAEPSRSSKAAKHQRKRQAKAAAKELEAAAAKQLQSETASGRAGARRAAVALLQQCAETMQALPGFNLLDATEDGETASGEGPWLLSEERDNKENTLFPGQNMFRVEGGADYEVSPEEFVDHVLGSVVAYPYEEKDYATCRENLKKALILEARGNINLSNGGAPHPEAARSFVAEYLKGRMARAGSSTTGTSGNVVGTRNVVAAAAVETLQRVIAPRLVERPVEHMTNYFRSLLEALVAGFRREEGQKFGQGSPTTRLAARGAAEGPNNRNAFSLASAMQQVLRGTVLDTPALSAAPLGSPERGSAYVSVRVTSTGTSAVEDDILLKRVPATVYNARASSPWQPRLPETSRTRESKLRALALAWATFVRSGPGAALLREQGSEDEGAASSLLKGHSYFLDDHAKQGFARAIEDLLALDSTEALFAHRAAFLESRLADWKTRRPGAALRAAAAAGREPSTSTSPHSFHYENPFAAELLEERAAPSEGESQRPVAADVGGDWFDEFKREVQKLLTKHGVTDRRELQRPPVNGLMHELLTTTFEEKSHVDQQVRYLANAKSRVADVLDRMYSEVSLYEIFFAAKLALRELVAAVFIEDEVLVEKDEGDRGHAAAAAHDVVADAAGDVEMMKEERVDGPLDDPRKIVEDEVRQFLLWEKVGQRQVRSVMAKEDRSSGSDYPRSNAVADEARLMEEWRAGRAGARFVPASPDDERKLSRVLMSEADDETADGQEPGTGVLEVRVQRIATKGRPAPGVDTATGAAADDASTEEDEVDAGDAGAGTKTMGGRNKTSSLDVATPREAEHLVCNEARIAVLGPLGRPIRATKDSGAAAPGSSQLVAASPRAATFSAKELTKTHRAAELQNVRSRRNLHKGRAQFDNNSPLHFLVFSDAFDAFAAEQRGGESSFGNGRKGVGVEVDPHEPHPVADALRKAFRAAGLQVEELGRGETKSIQSGRLQSGTRVAKSGDSQIWFRVLPTARAKHAHAEPHTQTEAQSGSGAVKWHAYRTEDFVYQQLTRARAEQREERELLEERRVARAERAIALGYKNTDGQDASELLQYRHSPKPGRGTPVLDEEFQFEPGDVILVEHIARLDLGAGAERLGFRVRRPLQPPATGEEAKLWLQDMSMSMKTK